ncbi:MAG TPA: molybdenum cofactor guanylyltransferase [Pyrinomonadaceae bacterium]|nr:molybdenum cofactor guanylyltransferase [Pyrinomonadaceae bacterium]
MNTDIAGFILAGGASRRMGRDKSQLTLGDESFVDRIARQLAPVTRGITLVGRNLTSAEALPQVADVYPKWGALGGVHAALSACDLEWCLVVACDLPCVTTGLFERLIELREDYDAVAPVQPDGIPQPLCTLYRVDCCRKHATELINSGERKPVALLQSVKTRWVPFSDLRDLPEAERFFENINTPQDYEALRKDAN